MGEKAGLGFAIDVQKFIEERYDLTNVVLISYSYMGETDEQTITEYQKQNT